ncbi:hypothetical protein H112_03417 [Trichophyton rubrum D6]|uniref:Uncharacterized protein n=2 Tax=Trichophyton TaxID=5550 RepID=A0A022W5T6_TRIRU|nr:hypothetical protein H102_03417 [Trichophyton rubrum CBS 100081]EZF53629.1 hypothetical protein H103_03426 [Trichophyton rubrum CBS 288.86]EZF74873.1 hypothetical protein H105_03438 [Trichophyton soudanense CBS 452.61]EZF85502.1 hypothetical protein H110_03423 [Trichophyton rubrum MR1448]EZF96181.1 hypothetical protein H113_03622 [Trichophyton rubrum MR1459]EZG01716.1 hypothetical protein H106_07797 [Trichophyton rubrum CBS 735.88]EZG17689.1 hypothetical protein H107_03533 [Trichophyton ru
MSELTATFDATTETVMRLPAPWLVLGNLARLEATYILHQVTEDGVSLAEAFSVVVEEDEEDGEAEARQAPKADDAGGSLTATTTTTASAKLQQLRRQQQQQQQQQQIEQ